MPCIPSPRLRCVLVLLALGSSVGPALAGTIRHDVNDQSYLDLAMLSEYSSVGRLDFLQGGTQQGMASGVLVAQNWVLTSASRLQAFAGSDAITFTIGGNQYAAAEWYQHPYYSQNPIYDLAVVRLSSPVPGTQAAVRYGGAKEKDAVGTILGYGSTGTGLSGSVTGTEGSLRAGQNVIDRGQVLFGRPDYPLLSSPLWFDFDDPGDADGLNPMGGAAPLGL